MQNDWQMLLVEDNEADAALIQEWFQINEPNSQIHWVKDGIEALDYLCRRGFWKEIQRSPDLVFLDLNIPKVDGREILREMRKSAELKTIPVLVLSTSTSEKDVRESYEYGANAFVSKPLDLDDVDEMIQNSRQFWLRTARLPKRN